MAHRLPAVLVAGLALLLLASAPARAQDDDPYEKWRAFLESNDPSKQIIGAHQLLQLADDRGRVELERVLREPAVRADVAVAVLKTLAVDRDGRLIDPMVDALDDGRPGVAAEAARSLAAFATDGPFLDALFARVDDGAIDAARRRRVVRAIGCSRSLLAVDRLIDRLAAAVDGGIDPLAGALERIAPCGYGADAAAWRTWWQAHRGMSREEILEDLLASRLRAREAELERRLADEVIPLVDPGNVEELQRAARSSLWSVRAYAARHLGRVGGEQAAAVLLQRIVDEAHPEVEIELVGALGTVGDPRAVPHLVDRLAGVHALAADGTDELEGRRFGALLAALGRLRDRQAVEPVATIAADLTLPAALRAEAVEALGLLGGAASFTALHRLSETEQDIEVLKRVAQGLGRIGTPASVGPLVALLGHADPLVRFHAADSLGKIGDAGAGPALLAALVDPVARVRQSVLVALGKIVATAGEAVEPVGRLLGSDPDALVRRAAAECLAAWRDPRAIAFLAAAQADPDAEVRQRAWAALVAIAGDDRARLGQAAERLQTRRPDLAAGLYDRLLEGAPAEEIGRLAVARARARIAMGEPGAAVAELDARVDLPAGDPAWWPVQLTRVEGLARSGRGDEARQALAALRARPDAGDRAADLAAVEGRLGEMASGSAAFRARRLLDRLDLDDAGRAGALRAAGVDVVRALGAVLGDTDAAVVWAAIRVLRVLSGTTYGFDPARPLDEQGEALEGWRQWIRNQG